MRKLGLGDKIVIGIIALIVVILLVSVTPGIFRAITGRSPLDAVPAGEVRGQLASLEVRDWSEAPQYTRSVFGEAWWDQDGNGCDTRNDVLGRDLDNVVYRPGFPKECVVQSGTLLDPYTGEAFYFERGADTSPVVQIDHVVPLFDAWQSGAWQWSLQERQEFANVQINLLAVSGDANQDKGHQTADQWLPPNKDYHCMYVARQVAVKSIWHLSVTRDEYQAMIDVLAKCPAIEVPY